MTIARMESWQCLMKREHYQGVRNFSFFPFLPFPCFAHLVSFSLFSLFFFFFFFFLQELTQRWWPNTTKSSPNMPGSRKLILGRNKRNFAFSTMPVRFPTRSPDSSTATSRPLALTSSRSWKILRSGFLSLSPPEFSHQRSPVQFDLVHLESLLE